MNIEEFIEAINEYIEARDIFKSKASYWHDDYAIRKLFFAESELKEQVTNLFSKLNKPLADRIEVLEKKVEILDRDNNRPL